jgi:thiamine biosynthesis lipoprotein
MGVVLWMWVVASGGVASPPGETELVRYHVTEPHMGVLFTLVLYAPDRDTANRGFEAAYARIRQLDGVLSDYESGSEAMRLCAGAPHSQGVSVSVDLWRNLVHAQQLSRRTHGAFDVTVGPLTKLWRRARRRREYPPADRLAEAREAVGYRYVELDDENRTARLARPGMRLDFGGLAKGYAADEVLKVLREQGIERALVNASGDIAAGGPPPDKTGWKIGIAPLEPEGPPSRFLLLADAAVATSGDAFQFVEIDGKRYSHIVDPRSGEAIRLRSSVSVIAPDGIAADGLASAVSVLGPDEGMELIEETPGTAAFIVVQENGKVRTLASRRFRDYEETSP